MLCWFLKKIAFNLVGMNQESGPIIHSIEAISHARWMAEVIFKLHIALFNSQLVKLNLINKTEAKKHRQLALFLILYYIPNWIERSLPFEAPRLDLQLYQKLRIMRNKRNVSAL